VSCTPTTRGRLTATLAIEAHSGTDTPSLFEKHLSASLGATAQAPVVFLAGAALPPVLARPGPVFPGGNRPPRLVVELTRLDFGAIAPGTAVVRPFWIRNVGDVPLTVTSVNSTVPGPFGAINLAIFPAVIAPGGELQVDVTFLAPAVVGAPAGADLWIETDDPLRPRAVLAVTGRASGGHLSTQPRELLQLDPGLPPTGQLTILSDGTDPVQVLKVGVQDRDFVISGLPAFPATLPSGSALTLDITYRGTTPGQHDSTLDLTDDISANGSLRILLRAFV
jgi:hypothetical protein